MTALRSGRLLVIGLLLAGGVACASRPPATLDDACAIFDAKLGWHRAAQRSHERWGVAPPVQLAFIHQESTFRARARPPRRRVLGFLPGPRGSSAYGYAQASRGTWNEYRRSTGRRTADRDDFADAVDFIGWYANRIQQVAGIPKQDAARLYLAYHEGPAGYLRGSHGSKPWLLRVSRRVAERARRYEAQYAACRQDLLERRRFWLF